MGRANASERLARLLALPAWIADQGVVTIKEAAEHFEVSEEQIRKDVDLLWMTGLPGQGPEDLVDFNAADLENGFLSLVEPLGLDLPVGLSMDEAASLWLALSVLQNTLETLPETDQVMQSAGAKLAKAMGTLPLSPLTEVRNKQLREMTSAVASKHQAQILRTLQRAIELEQRLYLRYVSATDVVTEREVDPLDLISDGTYLRLQAWCYRAGAKRTFRVDRIVAAQVLEMPVNRSKAHQRHDSHGSETWVELAQLTVSPGGRWIVEQIPHDSVVELPEQQLKITLRGRDRDWLVRLVLSAGKHMLRVEPSWLAQAAVESADRALKQYDHMDHSAC